MEVTTEVTADITTDITAEVVIKLTSRTELNLNYGSSDP